MAGSRWKIQLINGSEVKELLLNTEPLPTWPFGTLGDVGKINVLSTRNFKVESTPESDLFFEYMGKFNVVGTIQKRENFLTLLYDNEPVIENARVNKLSFENNQYSIILSGDNGVLISKLNSELNTLDWSAYTDSYDAASQAAGLVANPVTSDGFIYSKSIFDAQLTNNIIDTGEFFLPAFKLETVFNEILSQNGLSVTNLSSVDFQNNFDFLSQYIQLTEAKLDSDQNTIALNSENATGGEDITLPWLVGSYATNVTFADFTTDEYWLFVTSGDLPKPLVDGNITISLVYTEIQAAGAVVSMEVYVDSFGNSQVVDLGLSGVQTFTFTGVQYLNTIGVRCYVDGGAGGAIDWIFKMSIELVSSAIVVPFDKSLSNINLSSNIPDLNQIDIIKYIANYYSLLVDFDTVNDSIVFYDYTSLISKYNSSEYIDITDIIINPTSSKIDDQGNLAKANYLYHSNEDDVEKIDGRGIYEVANENLPTSRKAYESPFAYSNVSGTTAIIPYVQQDDNAPTYSFSGLSGIRLVNVVNDISIAIGNYSRSNLINLQYAVDTYYTDFNASNEDFKILSISVLADWTTIKEMISKAEKLPIFIDYNDGKTQINGIFKLNKISSWSDKKPTKLELKKLI